MLLYYHSWMFYVHFIVISYHFLVLTYWHSAQCQLLFSACFLHSRKSIPNGVQSSKTFCGFFWTRRHPVGQERTWGELRGEHNPRGRAGAPRGSLVSCAHPGLPLRYFFGLLDVFWSKKIHKKFRCVWTPFGIDFLRCKKHAENSNWHLALCQ